MCEIHDTIYVKVNAFKDNVSQVLIYDSRLKLKAKYDLLKFTREGIYYKYYSNGKVREIAYFHNNICEGDIMHFYDTGTLELYYGIDDKTRTGKSIHYFQTGELNFDCQYVDSSETLFCRTYYKSGKIKSITYGPKDSTIFRAFYENGNIFQQGKLNSSDLPIGEWRQYYENGIVQCVKRFKEGSNTYSLIDGPVYFYNEKVKLIASEQTDENRRIDWKDSDDYIK